MKKILFAAVAALAIVGCTQNEEFDNMGSKAEIKVGTVVKATTKAAVTDDTNFEAFKVNAYIVSVANIAANGLGDAYMDGVEYKGGKGKWATTGGTYYWPIDEKMQFFAYPSTITDFGTTDKSYPSFTFAVAAAAASQTDLVVAHASDATKAADNSALILTFKHILTRVNFSYKPEEAGYEYTISSIKIKDLRGGSAKYTFDEKDGSWDNTGATTTTYEYPITVSATAVNDYYALGDANASLMLLPQSIAGKVIEISYKTEKNGHKFFEGTKTVTIPAETAAWEIGQNIRYKLTLPVAGEAVKLDAAVSNWNEETDINGTTDTETPTV